MKSHRFSAWENEIHRICNCLTSASSQSGIKKTHLAFNFELYFLEIQTVKLLDPHKIFDSHAHTHT